MENLVRVVINAGQETVVAPVGESVLILVEQDAILVLLEAVEAVEAVEMMEMMEMMEVFVWGPHAQSLATVVLNIRDV